MRVALPLAPEEPRARERAPASDGSDPSTDALEQSEQKVEVARTALPTEGWLLTGAVRTVDGRPVRAEVLIHGSSDRSADFLETDARGCFRSAGHREAGVFLRARAELRSPELAPQVLLSALRYVEADSAPVELVVRPTLRLEGFVTDDLGRALEGFEAVVWSEPQPISIEGLPPDVEPPHPSTSQTFPQVVKREAGHFFVPGLDDGVWNVAIAAPGHVRSLARRVVPGGDGPLRIVLVRDARARGAVMTPSGALVPSAGVGLLRPDEPVRTGLDVQAICDERGRFELGLEPAAPAWLVATAEGYARSEATRIDPAPGEVIEGLTLFLREGARLEVAVRDAEGSPGSEAEVRVLRPDGGCERARRTLDGEVTFADLPAGRCAIEVRFDAGERRAATVRESVELRAGETLRVVVGGPPARPIRVLGRVHRRGDPVHGGEIHLGQRERGESASAPLDDEGRFELLLDGSGEYEWHALARDSASAHYGRVAIADADEVELDVALSGASLGGSVLGSDGTPAASIALELALDPAVADLSAAGAGGVARTDERGRFHFFDLPAGRYVLRYPVDERGAEPRAYARDVVSGIELAQDEQRDDLELRLARPAALEGAVRDARGRLRPRARVVAIGSDGRALPGADMETAGDGRFVFEGLRPGPIRVIAFSDEEASDVAGPIELASGERRAIDLDLAPAGAVGIRVFDAEGRAVGAALRAFDTRGVDFAALLAPRERAPGDAERALAMELAPLPPGRYVLRAINHDRVAGEGRVTVIAGETSSAELLLGR